MALIAHWPLDGRLDDVIGNYPATIVNRSPNQANNETTDYEVRVGGLFGEYLEKVGTAAFRNIEFMSKEDFKKYFEKNRMISIHMFVKLVKNTQDICIELIRNVANYPHIMGSGFWIDIRSNTIRIQTIYGEHNTGIDISKYLISSEDWLSVYLFLDFNQSECSYSFTLNSDVYTGTLKFDSVLSTELYIGIGGYNPSTKGTGYSSIRLYDHKLSMGEIKEIMKCKILHFKFNQIEIPQYNSAVSQTNIEARAGITISNKKQIKSWNFATISGTTSEGRGRKGIIKIPIANSIPSEEKYSIGIDFRIIGDDISNYNLDVISNSMAGNPTYTPTKIIGERYMYEGMIIVNTFDLCLYSKVDNYRIPDNVQILWRHIQLEPYPNCTPYVEKDTGSPYFHDSSDFRNKGTLGGMRFTPPVYCKENKSLTLYNDGSYSTINNIMTDIKLGPDILNQPDFEITIMCRIRTKNITGRGIILGCGRYGGIGIVVEANKICGYLRETGGSTFYIGSEANVSVDNNEFINISLTYSRVTGKLKYYANGIEIIQDRSGTFSFDIIDRFNTLRHIESSGNAPWLSGNIEISDVQVYRSVLTKEEIDEAFSKKIELTPKGILKSKYTSIKSSNLVDLNPPEYEYGQQVQTKVCSLLSSESNSVLIRGVAEDSYTPRYVLTNPIKIGDTVHIEFDTVLSDNCIGNISLEIYLFKNLSIDPGIKAFSFNHSITEGVVKTHKFTFTATSEFNFFRVDVNNSSATILYKDINISIVRNNVEISDKIKLDQISYRKSLPQTNLIDYTTWKLNTKGAIGEFNLNGTSEENKRMIKLNPWNKFDIVWATETNDIESNNDGGFNHFCNVPIDPKNTYRYSVWIRRENKGNGNIYLGPSNNGNIKDVVDWVASDNTSGSDMNPYWISSNPDVIKNDEWYLMVGYLYGKDIIYENMNLAQGIFDITGKQLVIAANRYRHNPANTLAKIRSYLYYSTAVEERCYWYRPRIDLCDGTEPTIDDLLKGREHGSIVEALGKFNPTFPPDEQFLEIKRAHGARWGKIFYHNNKAGTVLFSDDINEFLKCNTEDKKSILRYLPYMRGIDDKFEFLLEYDSFEGYNRWKQTSIFTRENISGYEAINISWNSYRWGGLAPAGNGHETKTYVDGSPNVDNWYYSLGTKINYANGSPGPGNEYVETKGVHLWVRLPEVAFITPDNTLVVNDIECP